MGEDIMQKVLSFSGGQTSGYMLRREIDRRGSVELYNSEFITIFCNTGKEHDATLDFVHDVESKWGVNIKWLEYTRIPAADIDPELLSSDRKRANLAKAVSKCDSAHWFREVNWTTASRRFDKWTPFDELLRWAKVLPNVRTRMCSVQMKLRTMQRYLRANGIRDYASFIGIRNDEAHRKVEILSNIESGEFPEFPLIDSNKSKLDVDSFWLSNPFRLNIPNHMGNCDLCFLKARGKRVAAAKADPLAAKWWSEWEDKFRAKGVIGDGATFQKNRPYKGIIEESIQPELFYADPNEEDVPCSCAVGGYRKQDEEE